VARRKSRGKLGVSCSNKLIYKLSLEAGFEVTILESPCRPLSTPLLHLRPRPNPPISADAKRGLTWAELLGLQQAFLTRHREAA
jgi:hypothetical protein